MALAGVIMGKYGVREEFLLAMYGGSQAAERELAERCVDDAFALIYEELNAALERLRAECPPEGLLALRTVERCYTRAIESAAYGAVRHAAGGSERAELPRPAIPRARSVSRPAATPLQPAGVARDEVLEIRYSAR